MRMESGRERRREYDRGRGRGIVGEIMGERREGGEGERETKGVGIGGGE